MRRTSRGRAWATSLTCGRTPARPPAARSLSATTAARALRRSGSTWARSARSASWWRTTAGRRSRRSACRQRPDGSTRPTSCSSTRSARGAAQPIGDFKNKEFWGVARDIESVAQFIRLYVADNPLDLAELPGRRELRHDALAGRRRLAAEQGRHELQRRRAHLARHDLGAIFALPGNDQPYPLILPSYAATAWYHKALPNPPPDLEPWLTEVRRFAVGDYAAALGRGATGSPTSVAPRSSRSCTLTPDCRRRVPAPGRPSRVGERVHAGALPAEGNHDRPARLAFRGPDLRPARQGDRERSAVEFDHRSVHGRVSRLVPRGIEVRRGQVLRRHRRRLADVGIQARVPPGYRSPRRR